MSQANTQADKPSPVLPFGAQVYTVGGAVRDALLGLASQDHDYVVVGTTPEAMLAAGFLAVGRDFPVFLHPQTHDEYALARTERKTAAGYHGFSFHAASDVTLEQDLARRDLTINAIAVKLYGEATAAHLTSVNLTALIDPFDGQSDLRLKVLRHVSNAFAEDPVRILRLARFAARYVNFSVAPETMALASHMVAAGEVDALVPERVWQEFAKGLMEAAPERMFAVLQACGALQRLLPELLANYPQAMRALNYASACAQPLAVRWATLQLPAAAHSRLKVPSECRDLALSVAGRTALPLAPLNAQMAVERLQRVDVLRKPERHTDILNSTEAILLADVKAHDSSSASAIDAALNRMRIAARAATQVDAGAVARQVSAIPLEARAVNLGERIKTAVSQARLSAVTSAFAQDDQLSVRALGAAELADSSLLANLTELLHRAYARLAAQGFNYTAVDQSAQVTAERLQAAAINFVALDAQQQVVGLISLHSAASNDACALYREPNGMHFGQFGVRPGAQGQGIGERLIATCADAARRQGADWLALDTSEGALQLRRFYKRLGYADCGFVQHPGKVYRSVLMKKPLWASA